MLAGQPHLSGRRRGREWPANSNSQPRAPASSTRPRVNGFSRSRRRSLARRRRRLARERGAVRRVSCGRVKSLQISRPGSCWQPRLPRSARPGILGRWGFPLSVAAPACTSRSLPDASWHGPCSLVGDGGEDGVAGWRSRSHRLARHSTPGASSEKNRGGEPTRGAAAKGRPTARVHRVNQLSMGKEKPGK